MENLRGDGQRVVWLDSETGERVEYVVNEETGEHQARETSPPSERVRRPRTVAGPAVDRETAAPPPPPPCQLRGSATSHRLLLIPASMIFPPVVSILLVVLEIYLHITCHRKNKSTPHHSGYYRSPFHALTSRFCGSCRESHSALVVGHLQDRRLVRYRYLRGLVS